MDSNVSSGSTSPRHPRGSRARRYLLICGLLALAGLLFFSWYVFRTQFPNFFDREQVDAAELEKFKVVDLSRGQERGDEPKDWPQFRGANRDGWSPGTNFRTDWNANPPKLLWSKPCGGGYSSFAAVDGKLYTMDREGANERIRCLNSTKGDDLWTHEYAADYEPLKMGYAGGPRATPTIHRDMLYAVGATGRFYALKLPKNPADKATVAWQHDLIGDYAANVPQWGVACSPLVEDDLVIVQPGGKKGSVVAFDRLSGEQRWTCESEPSGYSSPIAATLGGVRQIVAVTGKSILGIRAATGELLWKHPWETQNLGNIAMPVIAGDYVFVSSGYNKGCVTLRIEGETAKVVYFRPGKLMRNHHSTCVHKDGFLFGFDEIKLSCVNLRDGTAVEDWPTDDVHKRLGKGSVTLVGDSLLCLSERGTLMLTNTDPKEFQLLGRLDNVLAGSECWAMPAVVNGKIYLRDATKIVCLDASAQK